MSPDSDRTLHLHLAAFAAMNALAVSAWALSGAGGGSWPFWILILWGSALAAIVVRSGEDRMR